MRFTSPRILLACALMGISVCAFPVAQAAPTGTAPSVVLPLSEGPALARVTGRRLLGKRKYTYFQPTAAEVQKLEAAMPKGLTFYYRQYLGVTQVSNHARLIVINAFNAGVASSFTGSAHDWHRHVAHGPNGGTAFSHYTYNPQLQLFTGPIYNDAPSP